MPAPSAVTAPAAAVPYRNVRLLMPLISSPAIDPTPASEG
jgi:hypothetical protein